MKAFSIGFQHRIFHWSKVIIKNLIEYSDKRPKTSKILLKTSYISLNIYSCLHHHIETNFIKPIVHGQS